MQATIFDIQRFSVHDGPGIRTTVFFKGCNLHCFWCHNPESIRSEKEVQFHSVKCIGCGKCFAVCPNQCHVMRDGERVFEREKCSACGKCTDLCYAEALTMAGKDYTPREVLDIVMMDKPFYKENGGMTCSGGEPMLQKDFLLELLRMAKEQGIHTAVDTAGNVPFSWYEQILPYTDLFLFDLKCMDDATHVKAVGVHNQLLKENIRRLSDAGAHIWVRIPVIPGINANMENMRETAELVRNLDGVELVELLAFHKLGGGKYESLGLDYQAKDIIPPAKEQLQEFCRPFKDVGKNVKC